MAPLNLPLFPTTSVGSFPKPDYVKEAKGKLNEDSKRATREFIEQQEKIGIDALVDGEFYRTDMATDYARALGLRLSGWIESYRDRYWKKGYVNKTLERNGSIQLDKFLYAQSLTNRPLKAMLTGPTTLANWNYDSYYFDRRKLVYAWAKIVREEASELAKAGAKVIQVDEPAIGERIDEIEGLFINALDEVTNGLNAYTITHICYGDFVRFIDHLPNLPVNQIDMELSADLDLGLRRSELLRRMKKSPLTKHKDVAVGVIDIRPGIEVESLDTVVKRIKTAVEVFAFDDKSLRRIWIKPDCGFRSTKDREISYAKMMVMQEAVNKVREEFS